MLASNLLLSQDIGTVISEKGKSIILTSCLLWNCLVNEMIIKILI